MRIVALVPGGIGDQLLFFPTLDDLKQCYPNAEIDVVVEPRAKSAYQLSKSVNETIIYDFKDRNSPADWANLLGVIRDRTYDIAISLGRRWEIGLLLWLTGVPVRVGYDSGSGNFFLTNPVPLKTEQYAAQMYHDLLKGLGFAKPCPELSVSIPKRDLEWAEREKSKLGLSESGYVLIHAGSSELSKSMGINKIYPTSHWHTIIQDFQQKQPDLPIVVVQGPEDADIVAALVQPFPTLKVVSPGDLGKLATLIAGANLVLCTDSAPMHLAVALKVYTLALFGPTDPDRLLPKTDKVLGIKSPTESIADISPETVLKRVWGG
jgi:ADP-heptose:LPS heptosyltransferase